MTSPYHSPAYQPQQPAPAPQKRRVRWVYWALLVAVCLLSLVIGYAVGEYTAYQRVSEAIENANPHMFDT